MAESFFSLTPKDQLEALEVCSQQIGRPAHLLEKDVWVVWVLRTLFDTTLADLLTFKGGTSLSKAYKVIDRFSEDIDLTYDIRQLISDLIDGGEAFPPSRNQENKWSSEVRKRLPGWIENQVRPVIEKALAAEKLNATLRFDGDKLFVDYPATSKGSGYVKPTITLEFGGRATGQPHQKMPVKCDIDGLITDIEFPSAQPIVMSVSRTFWEKATAAHVYCAQEQIKSERFARHWHDLEAIARSKYFPEIVVDRSVANEVATHKGWFFREKDVNNNFVDYSTAVSGNLVIVPEGKARTRLADDYKAMLEDGVLVGEALEFDALMQRCLDAQNALNKAALEDA